MGNSNLEVLLQMAESGNEDAAQELYAIVPRLVFRFLWTLTSDEHFAEEGSYDTLTHFWDRLRKRKLGDGSFAQKVFRIARGIVYKKWSRDRQRCQKRNCSINAGTKTQVQSIAENRIDTNPEHELQLNELRAEVSAALLNLSRERREVLLLRHFENLTNAEIGLRLKKTPNAVAQQIARALEALEAIKTKFNFDDDEATDSTGADQRLPNHKQQMMSADSCLERVTATCRGDQ